MQRILSRHWRPSQTTLEILVVLGVMSMLFSVMIGFSRAGDLELQLVREEQRLISDIRRAQNLTYLSQEYDGAVPCGYGLRFRPEGYDIMVATVQSGDCRQPSQFDFSVAEKLNDHSITLSNRLAVLGASHDTMVFVPPEPKTFFLDTGAGGIPHIISPDPNTVLAMKYGFGTHERTIYINTAGVITVQ